MIVIPNAYENPDQIIASHATMDEIAGHDV